MILVAKLRHTGYVAEYNFLKNPASKKWVISAPRRAKRPDIAKGTEPPCPFCPGRENVEKEVYRIGGKDHDAHWKVRIIPNKFPFAPIHEVIIESPDHHKGYESMDLEQISLVFKAYRHQFNEYSHKGQVYIFHNHGQKGGESLPHPHSQLVVIPEKVLLEIPRLESVSLDIPTGIKTPHFRVFCPSTSEWPDEVWVAPRKDGRIFGEITDREILDLSDILSRLVKIFDIRNAHDFPYNYYIYPGGDWYLRLIPRIKTLGGFEIGTRVPVNTQNPTETMEIIKKQFHKPNFEHLAKEHLADYHRTV